MKKITLISLVCFCIASYGQEPVLSVTDSLGTISKQELQALKLQVTNLNAKLQNDGNSTREVGQLKERVAILEKLRETENKIEKNRDIENYHDAILNLLYLKDDFEHVVSYDSAKSFFTSLENASNPLQYAEYKTWFNEYKGFLERESPRDIILNMAYSVIKSPMVDQAGTLSFGTLSPVIFSSIEKFIRSLGSSKRDLKKQSARMFQLMVFLDNVQRDKNAISADYDLIVKELEIIRNNQTALTNDIYESVHLKKHLMMRDFVEGDHTSKNNYLGRVKKVIIDKIDVLDKQKINKQKVSVQSLKIRYGNLKVKLRDNLEKYGRMIEHYKTNEFSNWNDLQTSYDKVLAQFGSREKLEKYVDDAVQMYNRDY